MRSRAIYGCAGPSLSQAEKDFFRDTRPWGFILFGRNISSPEQVRTLIAELRATVDDAGAPILIDQEGGRVARMKPPQWHARPACAQFAESLVNAWAATRRCSLVEIGEQYRELLFQTLMKLHVFMMQSARLNVKFI